MLRAVPGRGRDGCAGSRSGTGSCRVLQPLRATPGGARGSQLSPRSSCCTPCHAWAGAAPINPAGEGECSQQEQVGIVSQDSGLGQGQEEALKSQFASSTARIHCRLSTGWGPAQPWPLMTPNWNRSSLGQRFFHQFSFPSVPQRGVPVTCAPGRGSQGKTQCQVLQRG